MKFWLNLLSTVRLTNDQAKKNWDSKSLTVFSDSAKVNKISKKAVNSQKKQHPEQSRWNNYLIVPE